MMRIRRASMLLLLLLMTTATTAETGKSVLDKAAKVISNKNGVSANFQMLSKQYGNVSGTIAVKGKKFHATTPAAIIWFDGKTQWTYMKNSEEVNVSNPTEAELQAVNPYNFINLYKKGFNITMKTVDNSYEVHLTAQDKSRKIQEMYIIVTKNSYTLTHVKMRQGNKWSTIVISNLQAKTLSDGLFQFSAKDFPQAEIIDLR